MKEDKEHPQPDQPSQQPTEIEVWQAFDHEFNKWTDIVIGEDTQKYKWEDFVKHYIKVRSIKRTPTTEPSQQERELYYTNMDVPFCSIHRNLYNFVKVKGWKELYFVILRCQKELKGDSNYTLINSASDEYKRLITRTDYLERQYEASQHTATALAELQRKNAALIDELDKTNAEMMYCETDCNNAKEQLVENDKLINDLIYQLDCKNSDEDIALKALSESQAKVKELEHALRCIVCVDTKTISGDVKKIAKIASEALNPLQ